MKKHVWNPIRETTRALSVIHAHAYVHMLTALCRCPLNIYQVQTIMHECVQQAKGGAGPRAAGKRHGGGSRKTLHGAPLSVPRLKAWSKFLRFITLKKRQKGAKKKRKKARGAALRGRADSEKRPFLTTETPLRQIPSHHGRKKKKKRDGGREEPLKPSYQITNSWINMWPTLTAAFRACTRTHTGSIYHHKTMISFPGLSTHSHTQNQNRGTKNGSMS